MRSLANSALSLGRWTCNQQVAGSTPGRRIAEYRPWASRSHVPSASEATTVWRCRNLSNLIYLSNLI